MYSHLNNNNNEKILKIEWDKTNKQKKEPKQKLQEIHTDTETHTFAHAENPLKNQKPLYLSERFVR